MIDPKPIRWVAGLDLWGPDKDGFYQAVLDVGTEQARGISRNPSAAAAYALESAAVMLLADARSQKDAGDPPA